MAEDMDIDTDKDLAFMDVQKALEKHYQDKKLQILVCGKTGTGKSSLLNTLFGKELFEIGGPGDFAGFGFQHVTNTVSSQSINLQNVLLDIFDSPGLQDGTDNDEKYLDDMESKCKNVNLVLYCIEMTTTRWLRQDVVATDLLTKRFTADFWKKTIVVLTKANMVKQTKEGVNEKIFCKNVYDSFQQKFQAQLIDQGVPESVVHDIPVVAAGSDGDRHLPYVSKAASDDNQEGYQDFLPELWVTCVERMSGDSRFNFLKVTDYTKRIKVNRDRLSRAQQELLKDVEQKYKEREMAMEKQEKMLNEKIAQLEVSNQKEIEKMRQFYEDEYKKMAEAKAIQQPPIVIERVVHRGCIIL